jgi:hypothetical protein
MRALGGGPETCPRARRPMALGPYWTDTVAWKGS